MENIDAVHKVSPKQAEIFSSSVNSHLLTNYLFIWHKASPKTNWQSRYNALQKYSHPLNFFTFLSHYNHKLHVFRWDFVWYVKMNVIVKWKEKGQVKCFNIELLKMKIIFLVLFKLMLLRKLSASLQSEVWLSFKFILFFCKYRSHLEYLSAILAHQKSKICVHLPVSWLNVHNNAIFKFLFPKNVKNLMSFLPAHSYVLLFVSLPHKITVCYLQYVLIKWLTVICCENGLILALFSLEPHVSSSLSWQSKLTKVYVHLHVKFSASPCPTQALLLQLKHTHTTDISLAARADGNLTGK